MEDGQTQNRKYGTMARRKTPSLKRVVMFSGGFGSWAAPKRVVLQDGRRNVTLLFADILIEDANVYRFLDEAAKNVGAPWRRVGDVAEVGDLIREPASPAR